MAKRKFPDQHDQKLIQALHSLKDEKEIEIFLRDLFTLKEIEEITNRLRTATLLWKGKLTYLEIAAKVGVSTTTVTRVASWLKKSGPNGFRLVLERLYPKKIVGKS